MQIHYDNWLKEPHLKDSSGIRVHLSAEKPKTVLKNVLVGLSPLSFNMRIPENMQDFLVSSKCRVSAVNPVTIYSYAVHAHIYGTKIVADVIRNGEVIKELGRDDYYDFDYQRNVFYKDENLPNEEILDGDEIRVRCWYDTRVTRKVFREDSLTAESHFELRNISENDYDLLMNHSEVVDEDSRRVTSPFELGDGRKVAEGWYVKESPETPTADPDESTTPNPQEERIARFRARAVAGGFGSGDEMCMINLLVGDATDMRGSSCFVTEADTLPFAREA